jgi:hypothetical protein
VRKVEVRPRYRIAKVEMRTNAGPQGIQAPRVVLRHVMITDARLRVPLGIFREEMPAPAPGG